MAKLAVVATMKVASERRDEYIKALSGHAQRCRATEPGTLQFEILVPHDDPGTIMLYELYASEEAFQAHLTGESIKEVRRDAAGIQVSLAGVRCDLVE